jgi:hypothetical protein
MDPNCLTRMTHPLTPLPQFVRMASVKAQFLWQLDADIALTNFSFPQFFSAWHCAFDSGPPLISQPVIRQSKQQLWSSNFAFWRSDDYWRRSGRSPIAARIPLVEQQASLLDLNFVRWLLLRVGQRFFATQIALRSDWGLDIIWCGAADEYTRTQQQPGHASRTSCAIIVEPIDHDDWKDVVKTPEYTAGGSQSEARGTPARRCPWLIPTPPHAPDD